MAIAFDEFDSVEASAADSGGVTGVTVDDGDFLIAMAAVSNGSGSTMTVSDATNGTWTVPTGSPVLADASSQGHIQYFTDSAALSAATVTFNPTGASADFDAVVIEVSGADAAGFGAYVEATGTMSVGTAGTASVSTGTLGQAANLIFSIMTHTANTVGLTSGSAFTLVYEDEGNAGEQAIHTQRLTTATASTDAVTVDTAFAASDGGTWAIAAIVVKEDTGGAAPTWGPLLGLRNNRLVVA